MAGIAQRSDLVTQFLNFAEWDTTLSAGTTDVFIQLTESMINGDLISPPRVGGQGGVNRMLKQTSGTMTTAVATTALPTDFLGVKSLRFTGNSNNYIVPKFMTIDRLYDFNNSTATNVPNHYSINGTNIEWGPVPDSAYSYTLLYFAKLAALINAADTNWVLTNFPDVYLFGMGVIGDVYLLNMDAANSAYARGYALGLERIRADDRRQSYPSGSLQSNMDSAVTVA